MKRVSKQTLFSSKNYILNAMDAVIFRTVPFVSEDGIYFANAA